MKMEPVHIILTEDDGADPKQGTAVAQKLADAKVAGVVGHLNSGVTIPASKVYNDAGIPMISGSATATDLTDKGFPVVFRTVGRDDQQGPAIASYLASQTKPKVVAVIDDGLDITHPDLLANVWTNSAEISVRAAP